MYPMLCIPAYKQAIWGGNKLKSTLGKTYEEPAMAESWELSCHADGLSSIANGEYAGKRLKDILADHPEYAGQCVKEGEEFPLLIKFIDANDDLSIQVHPTKETADAARGQQSKTEIWVVVDSAPGASLYYGFSRDVTRDEIKSKALDGSICEVLNKVPVKTGDVFHINAGTMHAIGSGLLIAEIQQSANTTFRAFDYMRKDSNGNMRALHVDDAARVANIAKMGGKPADPIRLETNAAYTHDILFDSELFLTESYAIFDKAVLDSDERSFEALLFIGGAAQIRYNGESYAAKSGDCYFIPATLGSYEINGSCCVLRNRVLRKEGKQ